MVLWRPKRPYRLTPKKDVFFIIRDWNAKEGSQEIPGVTGKFGIGIWNEVGQRLIEFCWENELVIANTLFQQHKRRFYTWTSPDGQQRNQSAKTRPRIDCGSDHELLIAKLRLKLNKAEKTTRPFRYDLNQIPYDYTMEVRNRFKGLDLIVWWTMDWGLWHCTGDRDQDHPHGKEMQKSKMAVWEALKIAVTRREETL